MKRFVMNDQNLMIFFKEILKKILKDVEEISMWSWTIRHWMMINNHSVYEWSPPYYIVSTTVYNSSIWKATKTNIIEWQIKHLRLSTSKHSKEEKYNHSLCES